MPFQASFFPVFVPSEFIAGFYKKLHFHLFELSHSEDELSSNDFVTESFSGLGNSEWDFHSSGFLHVQEIDKNSLCSFRTKVQIHRRICRCPKFGSKHQVELSNICPVFRTGVWVG